MSTTAANAMRLYDAVNACDPKAILSSLTSDFVGEVRDGRIAGLEQITDTRRWTEESTGV
jgi:hypothetical protein